MKFLKKMLSKRSRSKTKVRKKIKELGVHRLTVYKSLNHIYVQLFNSCGSKVILSSSSLDFDIKKQKKDNNLNKTEVSLLVGQLISKKIKNSNIKKLAFDRSGFKFHGRIKAIADALRKNGIKI